MHTHDVTKDLVFRLRLDEDDRASLDEVAAYYSAPAATVVRILIKEKLREIRANALPPTVTAKKRARKA